MNINDEKKQLIGSNITYLREKEGVSKYRLAQELGVNPSSITRWERGDQYPGYENMKSICGYFEIPIEYLELDLKLSRF